MLERSNCYALLPFGIKNFYVIEKYGKNKMVRVEYKKNSN